MRTNAACFHWKHFASTLSWPTTSSSSSWKSTAGSTGYSQVFLELGHSGRKIVTTHPVNLHVQPSGVRGESSSINMHHTAEEETWVTLRGTVGPVALLYVHSYLQLPGFTISRMQKQRNPPPLASLNEKCSPAEVLSWLNGWASLIEVNVNFLQVWLDLKQRGEICGEKSYRCCSIFSLSSSRQRRPPAFPFKRPARAQRGKAGGDLRCEVSASPRASSRLKSDGFADFHPTLSNVTSSMQTPSVCARAHYVNSNATAYCCLCLLLWLFLWFLDVT